MDLEGSSVSRFVEADEFFRGFVPQSQSRWLILDLLEFTKVQSETLGAFAATLEHDQPSGER